LAPLESVPNLVLVPADSVRFHERSERARTMRLVERLRAEKKLRNPPIVAKTAGGDHVLLDGANRTSALRELGFSHLPVQIIDYGDPEVRLKGWHHLLIEGRALDLRAAYAKLPNVVVREIPCDELTSHLELRRVFAVLVDESATCFGLFPLSGEIRLHAWIAVLHAVVAAYEGRTRLERIKLADYANLPDVFRSVDHQLVLVPTLSKVELLQLVEDGVLIPTGLTRHLIPGRALGLDLDLAFLTELASTNDKMRHFQRIIDDLEMKGRIRFYEESAFIMNE
jgi:hypothetical protein